ncbi:GSK3B-interacting protein-like [Panonychus citri]|uniref:GSK3B-interacting protein-like n=1 Tax=Panonychus citri TaxID=50023 RepID=UPI00230727BF|nr:GSK3B-interacting protein-like [Panonychus citri]
MAQFERSVDVHDSDGEDECDWTKEAQFIVKEFESVVNYISVSTKLDQSDHLIYFNCETKEGDKYCIELTAAGFRIVSNLFDTIDEDKKIVHEEENDEGQEKILNSVFYETMNALLDKMSPLYRIAFSNQLIEKLNSHINQ